MIDLLQPWIGEIVILLASIVGVGGSYGIYWKKSRDKADRLREALRSELESMSYFDDYEKSMNNVPEYRVITTEIYDSSAPHIGALSRQEIKPLVEFYSKSTIWQDRMKDGTHEMIKDIDSVIFHLATLRQVSIQLLRKHLNLEYENPTLISFLKEEGELISDRNSLIQFHSEMFISDGLIEETNVAGLYRVTKQGESVFYDEYMDIWERDSNGLSNYR